MRSAEGHEAIPLACSLSLPKGTCDGRLRFLRALELEAEQAYELVWGPSESSTVSLVIERQEVAHGHEHGEEPGHEGHEHGEEPGHEGHGHEEGQEHGHEGHAH